jgi:GntR family transcriptional regulator/MocR family aminotransferase
MERSLAGIWPVLAVDRASPKPLFRQLYEAYREAIVERRLRPGQRLPSTRGLASELGLSRMPVLLAFEQLLAEGYCESRAGSGTYVARALPGEAAGGASGRGGRAADRPGPRPLPAAAADAVRPQAPWFRGSGAFRVGDAELDLFPLAAWSRLVARHARDARLLGYGDRFGLQRFRAVLADYLRAARTVRCEADEIVVVSGSQQALDLAARVLVGRDDPVWIEEPGYFGAQRALAGAGARLVPVPVDEEGLDLAAGIALCPRPRAVYLTPSHQFPLGTTMSAARRLKLLDWARRAGVWILEDDYDSEFRYESQPFTSLQGLDRDRRVIYIGTMSKVLFPSLRVGYVVVPPDLLARFGAVRAAMDLSPPTLVQAALADFVADGHFARHLRRMRQLHRERRGALIGELNTALGGALELRGGGAGLHLVAALPRGRPDRPLCERAAEEGLWVMPLSEAYLGPGARTGFILGYGGTRVETMPPAVRKLAALLQRPPNPGPREPRACYGSKGRSNSVRQAEGSELDSGPAR